MMLLCYLLFTTVVCYYVTVLDALLQTSHVELLVGWGVVADVVGVVPAPQLYAGHRAGQDLHYNILVVS